MKQRVSEEEYTLTKECLVPVDNSPMTNDSRLSNFLCFTCIYNSDNQSDGIMDVYMQAGN